MGQPTDHQEMGQSMNPWVMEHPVDHWKMGHPMHHQETEGTLHHQQMGHPTDNPSPQLTQTKGYPADLGEVVPNGPHEGAYNGTQLAQEIEHPMMDHWGLGCPLTTRNWDSLPPAAVGLHEPFVSPG